jgi:hypothetical protein
MISSPRLLGAWHVVLAVTCAVAAFHSEIDGDPYWHMALGRAVLAHGSRVVPEPYAFPSFPSPVVVPEWLWGVLTYGLHQIGSWPLLHLLSCLLTAALAYCIARLGQSLLSTGAPGAIAVISSLVMLVVSARVRLRPELAGKFMLVIILLLSFAQVRAAARSRVLLGGALALCEVLWAQLHGSFVLAPPAYVAIVLPGLLRAPSAEWRAHLATFGALCAGLLTSAYGLGLLPYLLAHGQGEARLFVTDMMPPSPQTLSPMVSPYGGGFTLLWIIGICGMVRGARVYWSELLLGLLGALLASRSVRFFTEGAILVAPLAYRGAADIATLFPPTRSLLAGGMGCAAGAAVLASMLHLTEGWGQVGLAPGLMPRAAIHALRRLPAGSNVLTTYVVGAPLGFTLAGHVRTFVDGRTPLHFDDTDLALSRDTFTHPAAMRNAQRRYGARAVVLERGLQICQDLEASWSAVAIDPLYTTFVPRGQGEPLGALSPCGPSYVRADACADGGARLDADLARLEAMAEGPFVRYLRAERLMRCGGPKEQIQALLPGEKEAAPYARQRAWLWVRYLLDSGRPAEALQAAAPLLTAEAVDAAELQRAVAITLRSGAQLGQLRPVLERAAKAAGGKAPAELHALVAALCVMDRDEDCARFHGLRAAARGAKVDPVLTWLQENHSSAVVRADAAAWQDSLKAK